MFFFLFGKKRIIYFYQCIERNIYVDTMMMNVWMARQTSQNSQSIVYSSFVHFSFVYIHVLCMFRVVCSHSRYICLILMKQQNQTTNHRWSQMINMKTILKLVEVNSSQSQQQQKKFNNCLNISMNVWSFEWSNVFCLLIFKILDFFLLLLLVS